MKTFEQVVDDVFIKEGDVYAGPPQIDQPTGRGGIILPTLQAFFDSLPGSRKTATLTDLQALSHQDARDVVRWVLNQLAVKHGLNSIPYEPVRLHAIDFAFNSGPALAIRWLQRCVQVPPTGVMDYATIVALQKATPFLLNQAYVAARLQMIDMWTDADQKRKAWEEGLENRVLAFSLLTVP